MHEAAFSHDHRDLYEKAVDIEGIEQLTLTSVGIDIGSSTTHLLFSRLTLRREGAGHSTKFNVTDRKVLWSSPILLTPYLSKTKIDFGRIKDFIHDCYHSADLESPEIDTGAVIITGEALKKENARPIIEHFMYSSGKFICASAGPHHEALLAAYGCGAVQHSKVTCSLILNVDIGGGTTKFSVIDNGEIVSTAAINVGARLIAFDKNNIITRIEDVGLFLAKAAGHNLDLGDTISEGAKFDIGKLMSETIIEIITNITPLSSILKKLMITDDLLVGPGHKIYNSIMLSGGVAEYVYNYTQHDFGDLGATLGNNLRSYLATLPTDVTTRPVQAIRATVIGASEYTIQVSGATSFFTSTAKLPAYGLKAVQIQYKVNDSFAAALKAAFTKYDIETFIPNLVLAISIIGDLNYESLKSVAFGLYQAVSNHPDVPLILIFEQDVARSVGTILKTEFNLQNELISIDGISVGVLDYIDIGKPVSMMELFPVTVKSLLFSSTL